MKIEEIKEVLVKMITNCTPDVRMPLQSVHKMLDLVEPEVEPKEQWSEDFTEGLGLVTSRNDRLNELYDATKKTIDELKQELNSLYDGKWTSHDAESIPVLLKILNEQRNLLVNLEYILNGPLIESCSKPIPTHLMYPLNLDAHTVAHELNKNINDKIPIEQQIVWEIDEIDEYISIYGESEYLLESKKKLEKQLEELSNEKSHS